MCLSKIYPFQGNEYLYTHGICKFNAPKYPINNSVRIIIGGIF